LRLFVFLIFFKFTIILFSLLAAGDKSLNCSFVVMYRHDSMTPPNLAIRTVINFSLCEIILRCSAMFFSSFFMSFKSLAEPISHAVRHKVCSTPNGQRRLPFPHTLLCMQNTDDTDVLCNTVLWSKIKIQVFPSTHVLQHFQRKDFSHCRSQWFSGSTLACRAKRAQVRIALRTKVCVFTKITSIRSFGHGLHTYCSSWVDSAFHPPRDGKWVSNLWSNNNTWRWANVRSMAAYRRTQRSSLQFGLRVGGHLALTDFDPEEPHWTLAYG